MSHPYHMIYPRGSQFVAVRDKWLHVHRFVVDCYQHYGIGITRGNDERGECSRYEIVREDRS